MGLMMFLHPKWSDNRIHEICTVPTPLPYPPLSFLLSSREIHAQTAPLAHFELVVNGCQKDSGEVFWGHNWVKKWSNDMVFRLSTRKP